MILEKKNILIVHWNFLRYKIFMKMNLILAMIVIIFFLK